MKLGRLRSPLMLSLVDQVLVSAANLGLSFWLISRWPPASFGVFAIVTSISLTGLALHQALAGSQLPLMQARATEEAERSEVLATAWAIALAVALGAGLATAVGFVLLSAATGVTVALLAGSFVALHVCREHVRTYHFAVFEVGHAVMNDFVHASIVLAIIAGAVVLHVEVDLAVVLAALAVASGVALLPTLLSRRKDFALRMDLEVRRRMRALWQDHGRWALLGAGAAEMQTRGHVAAVSAFFSVADLGIIQAALMLLRPIGLLANAWAKIARPAMAHMFAQQRVAAAVRYAHLSALGFAVATLLYLIALWFCWPVLAAHALPPAYHGLQAVVPLWGIATLFGLLRSIYSLEAQCVPIFREAFYASAVAMVTVFAGLVLAVAFGTATTTVLAVAAGETAALVVLLLILRRRFGRPADRPVPTAAP